MQWNNAARKRREPPTPNQTGLQNPGISAREPRRWHITRGRPPANWEVCVAAGSPRNQAPQPQEISQPHGEGEKAGVVFHPRFVSRLASAGVWGSPAMPDGHGSPDGPGGSRPAGPYFEMRRRYLQDGKQRSPEMPHPPRASSISAGLDKLATCPVPPHLSRGLSTEPTSVDNSS